MLTWARMLVLVTIGFGFVETAIWTNPKPMKYRSLSENTGIEISQQIYKFDEYIIYLQYHE